MAMSTAAVAAAPPTSSLVQVNPKSPEEDDDSYQTRIDQLASQTTVRGVTVTAAEPIRIQPTKPISLSLSSSGVPVVLNKRHNKTTSYKECLKNHAASIGGHALDGCGEFMPSPDFLLSDPTSLKCAACGCHRNFHRRQPDDLDDTVSPLTASTATATANHVIEYHPHHRHHPPPPPLPPPPQHRRRARSPTSQSPPPISSSYYPASAPHMLLALSTGVGGGERGGILANNVQHRSQNHHHHPQVILNNNSNGNSNSNKMGVGVGVGLDLGVGVGGRKRFRTKFSQYQKDRMFEFAEKVGWKMHKSNDQMVADFCNEIGVDRGVLKVWMHNNKNTYAKIKDLNNNLLDEQEEQDDVDHPPNNPNRPNLPNSNPKCYDDDEGAAAAGAGTNRSSSSS